ncbi:MAG: tetratricopeptide repeat protein, partial [Acidobacteria bacterium]|nr:tetratricopeptide repeat protein [Acidobacteriota bacterium]
GGNRDRDTRANGHYRLGLLSFQRGDLARAIEELKKSVELNPDSEQAHNLMGLIYLDSRQYPEAERHLRRALDLNPHFTDVYNNLGIVYRKMGDFPRALAVYDQALLDPTYRTPEKVHFNRGQTYLEMQEPEKAVESLRTAIAIAPRFGKARLLLAETFRALGRHAEAKAQLELVIQVLPDTEESRRAQDLLDAKEF